MKNRIKNVPEEYYYFGMEGVVYKLEKVNIWVL